MCHCNCESKHLVKSVLNIDLTSRMIWNYGAELLIKNLINLTLVVTDAK